MTKRLENMTNEELWELFPIELSEHNPGWAKQYEKEKSTVLVAIGRENMYRINHCGSTSVKNLLAKPTIDILLEVFEDVDDEHIIHSMKKAGYLYSNQPENPAPHMMFMKGYTLKGFAEEVFHVHVRYPGDWGELYFRDYLRDHSEIAFEYSQLKQKLRNEFKHDRDAYTAQKTDFITSVTSKARVLYLARYSV